MRPHDSGAEACFPRGFFVLNIYEWSIDSKSKAFVLALSECYPKNATGICWNHWLQGKLQTMKTYKNSTCGWPCQGNPPQTSRIQRLAACKEIFGFTRQTPCGWNLILNPNMIVYFPHPLKFPIFNLSS